MDSKKTLRGKKVLVTCGPTWVPLDDMRVLSNRSTGEMGYRIADAFRNAGAEVTVLKGPTTYRPKTKPPVIKNFFFYDELRALLKKELKKKYAVVVHAAAVSDFKPKRAYRSKLDSGVPKLKLTLFPTEKIIHKIKRLDRRIFLVGFKLESSLGPRNIARKTKPLFSGAGCDLVVANSVREGRYAGFIIDKSGTIISQARTRKKIADRLVRTVKDNIVK